MKHFTQKLRWFLMSLMLCAWVGTVWGQSSGPKITYDFSGEEFTVENGAVVNSDKSITMNGAGSANFKFNTGYFMMGKNGAYLTLPTFDFDVEKIVLTGRAAASTSTGMNIYVGEKAVSTATTGCTGTNTYEIASDYQSAGNAYTIKVTSSHNAQITKIEVYEVSSDPGTETDPEPEETGDYDYEKITSVDDLEDGEYLIVYEDGDVAFDGSLEELDAASNNIGVTITDNKIAASKEIDKATFTIENTKEGYTVKSTATEKYIGQTSYSNGLKQGTTPYYHKINFEENGDALITLATSEGDLTLRFNSASNQDRFRYYKSGQKAIQLYKKTQLKATNVEMPTFSPEGGEYTGTQSVTISCATEGASIYYTTDGSTPTDASTPYTGAISIEETTTIKAIAYDATGESSNIATAVFTIKIPHTWDVTEQGYTETTELETVLTDPVTIIFDVAEGGTTPKYYTTGDAARLYGKNTLTVKAPEGKAISSIKVNYVKSNAGELTVDCGSYSLSDVVGTWTGVEPTVTFTNPNDKGHYRIQSIDVETVDLEEIGTVTVSAAGYATYCNLQPCIVGDGSVTFVVPMAEGSTLEEEAIGTIPAGTGVLVKGEGTYKVYGHAKLTGEVKANHLIGVVEETTVPSDCYVLQNQDGNVAFYKVQEGTVITLGANKAYLDSSIDAGGAVKAFFMGEEADDATGIDTVDASAEKATEIYNLNGQRVSVMTKGIYVVNGKKVLVK